MKPMIHWQQIVQNRNEMNFNGQSSVGCCTWQMCLLGLCQSKSWILAAETRRTPVDSERHKEHDGAGGFCSPVEDEHDGGFGSTNGGRTATESALEVGELTVILCTLLPVICVNNDSKEHSKFSVGLKTYNEVQRCFLTVGSVYPEDLFYFF
ncbi:hypothetical protein F3Y22_tig00009009pilonHSYRG00089 [Hibiscus syriacus]|uniref:Uncharacterized protein n=1 Tax=Hibiscus syriacus TaxID=106335 RepID=A0A6A3C7N5_HIBSY|nr:hypothetical protein F3Y22_tig00009009pilonHSYRG00089 [Hibiscus syriacus]